MRDLLRMFLIEDETGEIETLFSITVESNICRIEKKMGRRMTTDEVHLALGIFVSEYADEHGVFPERILRAGRYRFCTERTIPECKAARNYRIPKEIKYAFADSKYYLEYEIGDGIPERRHVITESANNKYYDTECSIYDLLDFCLTIDAGVKLCDNAYMPCKEAYKEHSIRTFRPKKEFRPEVRQYRDIDSENGWAKPSEIATKVIGRHD